MTELMVILLPPLSFRAIFHLLLLCLRQMFGGGIRFGWGSGRWLIRPMQCVHARFSGVRGSPVADLLPEMLAGLATGSAVSLLQLCEGNSVGHSRGVMLPLHPPCRVAVLDLLCLQWVVIWVGHLRLLHMFLSLLKTILRPSTPFPVFILLLTVSISDDPTSVCNLFYL
ncbi:uncharacterized protein [Lolium perenne]|uniref:uncharacterized protein isoform X2 n=1 Tax=Lolium perenne TaxID=4522 RepID=UPI0021F5FD8F|nr:uncharacterized protein LOC127300985 isoform X2 [Lolium perenne]